MLLYRLFSKSDAAAPESSRPIGARVQDLTQRDKYQTFKSNPGFLYLVDKKKKDKEVEDESDDSALTCAICYNALENDSDDLAVAIPCDHVFHRTCLLNWTNRGNTTCPICRSTITNLNSLILMPILPSRSEQGIQDIQDLRRRRLQDAREGRNLPSQPQQRRTSSSERNELNNLLGDIEQRLRRQRLTDNDEAAPRAPNPIPPWRENLLRGATLMN